MNLPKKMGIEPLWEDHAGRIYQPDYVKNYSRRPREYQFILDRLPAPSTLFEIGCGRGEIGPPTRHHVSQITKIVLHRGHKLYGSDLHGIRWKEPNFHYLRGNFLETEFPENFFDAGYAVQVISHIGMKYFVGPSRLTSNEPYDEDADYRVFQKIEKILKPGGVFLTCFPIANKFTVEGYRSPEGVNLLPSKKGRIYDKKRIDDIMNATGLKLEELEIYKAWNPKIGDKTVELMKDKGQNYLALTKIVKPS